MSIVIKFQKILTFAASASNIFEAEAAERAARRLMETCSIDPVTVPDQSFVSRHINFDDNALLQKLRDEWRAAHPNFYYSKPNSQGIVRRLRHKPQPRKPKPVDVDAHTYDGLFDEVFSSWT